MIIDVLLDVLKDNVVLFPFLFLAFLILELLEHSSKKWNETILLRFRKLGPLLGALLGCIPECGIPVLTANLFCASLVSPGTLLAVFLSSSDEAILLILRAPNRTSIIWKLLLMKCIIAIIGGYFVDLFFAEKLSIAKESSPIVGNQHCDHHSHNLFAHAFQHAFHLFCYLFLFTFVLNLLLEWIGFSKLTSFLLKGSLLQPLITACIGFIPSCASSILLTELFIEGIVSFPSLISGLCATTGVGIAVLFKMDEKKKNAFQIIGVLWILSAASGVLLSILGM